MAITISDVAREANVSTSTVSKVLNHWSTISPETCERVFQAIEKLNYVPNTRAVSFAKGSTNTIIFLSRFEKEQAYQNPHMFDILCGAQQQLAGLGYSLLIVGVPSNQSLPDFVHKIIMQKSADGIIIHGSAYIPALDSILLSSDYPHILIGHPASSSRLCWIDTNNGLAGEFAASHMVECGYKNVAFIGSQKAEHISTQRLNGFVGKMYQYGFYLGDPLIGYTYSTIQDSYNTAYAMLNQPMRPRGIVCENNTIAIGVTQAISALHLQIPDDIALLTFDIYPYSMIINPKPTVIDINVFDLGIQAANALIQKIHNPSLLLQSYTTLPVLIQGLTTQSPASA